MDEVDRKIVTLLQHDGRTTLNALGKTVGYSSMGAKKRVDRLLQQGEIKVSALLNFEQLHLTAAVVLLEMESAQAMHNLLKRFKECPRVVHIFTTLGGYNLIALIVAENQETLESISMERCSLRSSEGIRRSEFYPIGNILYSPYIPIRWHLTHQERTTTPCNVDCRPCDRYIAEKCVGCSAASYYKGSL